MSNLNLMVGDWVIFNTNSNPIKVTVDTLIDIEKYKYVENKPYDYVGIFLSPEVMEKIENISKNENRGSRYGFLDGYYNIDRDTDLVAIFEDDGLLYIYTYEYSHEQFQLVCTFQYLHQLQQLIRLFTGKEIEVKWEK